MRRRLFFSPLWLPALLGLSCLAGCASWFSVGVPLPERAALERFSLEGRFSLSYEGRSYSGRLSWRHVGARNEVLLSSPFGQGLAEIVTGEDLARLTTAEGQVHVAADAETLTRQVLGYALPLSRLTDWVRGRHGSGAQVVFDAFGRVQRLRQDGWEIDYGYADDAALAPPVRIFAERFGEMALRLRIDEWNALPGSAAQEEALP